MAEFIEHFQEVADISGNSVESGDQHSAKSRRLGNRKQAMLASPATGSTKTHNLQPTFFDCD